MFVYLLLFGVAFAAPANDGILTGTDILSKGNENIKNESDFVDVSPFGLKTKNSKFLKIKLSDFIDVNSENYGKFITHIESGHTLKSLTFNIYDDSMREATIILYRIICFMDLNTFYKFKQWAVLHINDHMFDYVERLCSLYGSHTYEFSHKAKEPPFLFKPNFYTNGETIIKSMKIRNDVRSDFRDSKFGKYNGPDTVITINTNYSGWNIPQEGCGEKLDFFTEDIGLNSFYYGIHLSHPFWMPNNEMDEINPRHSEHYYFSHKQLWARYQLELESARQRNVTRKEICEDPFIPYLIYDNGLPFPTRSNVQGDHYEERTKLSAIDIAIKECVSRGFLIMGDGTERINLTEDNYITLISKLIRANYDGTKTAKIIRNLYGYGRNGFPNERYNPAPSLIHQPETTLRDPVYWYFIEYMLKYFDEFENTLPSFDMSQYETPDYEIVNVHTTKLSTFFTHYSFVIDEIIERDYDALYVINTAARQRRLAQLPWSMNITIKSTKPDNIIAKLFLGPPCSVENCWEKRKKFFLLDIFRTNLNEGYSNIYWQPNISSLVSSDLAFNREGHVNSHKQANGYNMFKFPQNLLLPKGSEEGVNMTMFIIIMQNDNNQTPDMQIDSTFRYVSFEQDALPLDFPFHRSAFNYKNQSTNYRFYNITIYHKKRTYSDDGNVYFSSHLY